MDELINKLYLEIETHIKTLEKIQQTENDMPLLNSLSKGRILTIKEFFICKLARQLYDCVDCPEPRWNTDRQTAENFVNERCDANLIERMAKRDVTLRAYESLIAEEEGKKTIQKNLPAVCAQILHASREGNKKYLEILLLLKNLPEKQLAEILKEAAKSSVKIDCYLGRLVWENGYQRIKSYLPRPPYGNIRFL